jgi:hypothetical protein
MGATTSDRGWAGGPLQPQPRHSPRRLPKRTERRISALRFNKRWVRTGSAPTWASRTRPWAGCWPGTRAPTGTASTRLTRCHALVARSVQLTSSSSYRARVRGVPVRLDGARFSSGLLLHVLPVDCGFGWRRWSSPRAGGVLSGSAGPSTAADVRRFTSPMARNGCCAALRGSVFHSVTSVSRLWRTSTIGTPSRALMVL